VRLRHMLKLAIAATCVACIDAMVASTTLYDIPISNHGARVRLILYKKKLEAAVKIVSPGELGGLGSDEYLSLNPQGKMPLLVDDDLTVVWESDAICRHLLDKHSDAAGPSFFPRELSARTRSEMLCRLHDAYIGPIQGCLYRDAAKMPQTFSSRAETIRQLRKQLAVAEDLADGSGPYLTGEEISLADATLFPTMVFVTQMLPKFEEAIVSPDRPTTTEERDAAADALGPKLLAWWAHMTTKDPEGMRVHEEISGGIKSWEKQERWAPLLGAGTRDTDPPTIFDMILKKEIPSDVVFEDEHALAFRDINPVAPTHVLVIPKLRQNLRGLGSATPEHTVILGHLMRVAAIVAEQEGLQDFRVVSNNGEAACQSVFHLHLHVIGGRALTWPPG